MATKIFPSYNDIGNSDGDGNRATEENTSAIWNELAGGVNGVISDMAVSNPSGVTIRVASGQCLINGYLVTTDANLDEVVTDDGTPYYVYLELTRDASDRVTGIDIAHAGSKPAGADQIIVSYCQGTGGSMTWWYDERASAPGTISGTFTGDDAVYRTIDLGRMPSLVFISMEDAGNILFGISQIEAAGNRASTRTGRPTSRVYFEQNVEGEQAGFKKLTGSTSWDESVAAAGVQHSETITVTGAAVGDAVYVRHSDHANFSEWICHAVVTAANTVTVYILAPLASTAAFSGTIYAVVFDDADLRSHCQIVTGSGSTKCPEIITSGFQVGHGTYPSLNETGIKYNYLAIF